MSAPDEDPKPVGNIQINSVRQWRTQLGLRVLLLAVFASLSGIYLCWGWSNDITDLGGDSSVYMLAAHYFSPFWPHSSVSAEFARGMVYPPLFPLLIGLLGGSMLAGHLLVIVSLLAAILCLYAWLRIEGLSITVSLCTCLVFALMPGTYLQSLNIWTENLYLFLSLLAIAFEACAEKGSGQQAGFRWGAAAAVAGATMVRAAALPLLAAFLIRLVMTRPRRWPWLMLTSITPFALWSIWSRLNQSGVHSYLSQLQNSYTDDLVGAFFGQLGTEGRRVLMAWPQSWLATGGNDPLHGLTWAIGAICLFGWAWRLARSRFDAFYLGLYVIVLFIWPYPAEARRLSYVMMPLLIGQGVLLIVALSRANRKNNLSALPWVWFGAMTIAILPSLILTAQRFHEILPDYMSVARHTEDWYGDDRKRAFRSSQIFAGTLNGLKDIISHVPTGDCIFSIKPSIVAVYSDRHSYSPPSPAASDEQFDRGIGKCPFAYLFSIRTPAINQLLYPMDRLGDRAEPILVAKSEGEDNFLVYAALVAIKPRQQ